MQTAYFFMVFSVVRADETKLSIISWISEFGHFLHLSASHFLTCLEHSLLDTA